MLSSACSTEAVVPFGLSPTLALYSRLPWMMRFAFSSKRWSEMGKPPISPMAGGLERFYRGGEEDERTSGFHAVGEGLLLHSHRKIVSTGARADSQIFADIGDAPSAGFHAADKAGDAGAHLVEAFRVLL